MSVATLISCMTHNIHIFSWVLACSSTYIRTIVCTCLFATTKTNRSYSQIQLFINPYLPIPCFIYIHYNAVVFQMKKKERKKKKHHRLLYFVYFDLLYVLYVSTYGLSLIHFLSCRMTCNTLHQSIIQIDLHIVRIIFLLVSFFFFFYYYLIALLSFCASAKFFNKPCTPSARSLCSFGRATTVPLFHFVLLEVSCRVDLFIDLSGCVSVLCTRMCNFVSFFICLLPALYQNIP